MGKVLKENEVLKRLDVDVSHFDAHMHLAWIDDKDHFYEELKDKRMKVFACTVKPSEFLSLEKSAGLQNAFPALGLHPWFLEEEDIEQFARLAPAIEFIGEIGLDFRSAKAKDRKLQIMGFEVACNSINPNSIISIHSVGTKGKTHEILKSSGRLDDCICIYHWFSDDAKTLSQAIEDGCYFSINRSMFESRRGKEYLKVVPKERILLETDSPRFRGDAYLFSDLEFMSDTLLQL